MPNLKISYLYRDTSNYKQFAQVIIANPDNLTLDAIEEALSQRFASDQVWPDVLHFQPEALGWPITFFEDHDLDEDDLELHELEGIEPANDEVTHTLPSVPG